MPYFSSTVVGFRNLGNTCYANATLQCLIHSPLQNAIQSSNHKQCTSINFCSICAMKNLLQLYQVGNSSISPQVLVSNVSKLCYRFRGGRQEDAHEFLRYLLDHMITGGKMKPKPGPISDLFNGILKSVVTCEVCQYQSVTKDRFLDLSLELSSRCHSVEDALVQFTRVERLGLQNKVDCTHCKKRQPSSKGFLVSHAPELLVIHLKRFDFSMGRGIRIGRPIHFQETLDLSPFCSEEITAADYELTGIVVHSGVSCEGGHYFGFVKSSGIWNCADDSHTSPVSVQTVLSQVAYILFYKRVFRNQVQRSSNPTNSYSNHDMNSMNKNLQKNTNAEPKRLTTIKSAYEPGSKVIERKQSVGELSAKSTKKRDSKDDSSTKRERKTDLNDESSTKSVKSIESNAQPKKKKKKKRNSTETKEKSSTKRKTGKNCRKSEVHIEKEEEKSENSGFTQKEPQTKDPLEKVEAHEQVQSPPPGCVGDFNKKSILNGAKSAAKVPIWAIVGTSVLGIRLITFNRVKYKVPSYLTPWNDEMPPQKKKFSK